MVHLAGATAGRYAIANLGTALPETCGHDRFVRDCLSDGFAQFRHRKVLFGDIVVLPRAKSNSSGSSCATWGRS